MFDGRIPETASEPDLGLEAKHSVGGLCVPSELALGATRTVLDSH